MTEDYLVTKSVIGSGDIPPRVDGVHLWVVQGLWQVNPLARAGSLTSQNLIQVAGPLCFWCHLDFTLDLAARQCSPPETTLRHT